MSLSVFSHRDISAPISVFIPCRSEICQREPNISADLCESGWIFVNPIMRLCADLCQPLREAGGLSLGERQEEGLLPEGSQSWNISERKEM